MRFKGKFTSGKCVVVGDLMVDEYKQGTVTRISPEAPIPVLDYKNRTRSPGGAANVAMNLAQTGNHTELLGVVGDDEPGTWLVDCLRKSGVGVDGIVVDAGRPTTTKVRYFTRQQSLLRVDYEDKKSLDDSIAQRLTEHLFTFLLQNKVNAIMVSDYCKGVIFGDSDENPLMKVIHEAAFKGIVCVADTKRFGRELGIFHDFAFVKPNLSELEKAVGYKVTIESLKPACEKFLSMCGAKSVVVTLGEEGMYHFDGHRGVHVGAVPVNVSDVTGAGDTAFTFLTQCLSQGWPWIEAMKLANIAAAIAVESRGTKVIHFDELSERIESLEKSCPEYFAY